MTDLDRTYTLELTHLDLINLAFATGNAATSSYIDQRLTTAATEHAIAARLWTLAECPTNAQRHTQLSYAITREAIEWACDP